MVWDALGFFVSETFSDQIAMFKVPVKSSPSTRSRSFEFLIGDIWQFDSSGSHPGRPRLH